MSQPVPSRRQLILRWGVFLGILTLLWIARRREAPPVDPVDPPPAARATAPPASQTPPAARPTPPVVEPRWTPPPADTPQGAPAATGDLVIEGLALRNADGRTIYRGAIDLAPTLERIAAGKRLRFPNDGAPFQNRERRLPRKPSGHYREWVVPTPGESGPGPQRLVTGEDGEVWYTADHYRTFRRINTKALSR